MTSSLREFCARARNVARWSRAAALSSVLSAAAGAGCAEPQDHSANEGDDDASEARDASVRTADRDSGTARDAGKDAAISSAVKSDASVDAGRTKGDAGVPTHDAGATETDAGLSASDPKPLAKKFVGNITTSGQVRPDFADYWDQITPENEGKWGSVEAVHNQMNWSGLDRVHDYAKQHGIVFKQHNFVWGNQQPSWLSGMPADQQRAEVEEWIRLFCERYPDVALIDVVNEPPPHTTPVYMQALGGAGKSGYDWIVQAFTWARQYCPNAKLILNDYNNIEYQADNSRFTAMVQAIQAAGASIDAVGAQAHDAYKLPADTVQKFIDQLGSATKLPVYITEYDINIADDTQQQQVMQSQFTMFWNDAAVAGITLWGYVVGATWKANTGLMTSGGMPRPALGWLDGFLDRGPGCPCMNPPS
ncbi:MAG TPA: endo-1,4-beta-xylanase, partial [Polyangiaceae bacterium]|nr:endo-1,4-beta-xylanase [Polyangiaceae bacterium]